MSRWRRGRDGDPPTGGHPSGEAVDGPVGADADHSGEDPAPPRPALSLPWPPLIHTEAGFSLRPWGASPTDAEALAAAWSDPDVQRWTKVPEPRGAEAASRWIAGEEARRASGTAVDLVIAELGAPEHVLGEVGLVVVEPERGWAEVGYWLLPDARGSGRATAALRGFADWALRDLPVSRLIARTHQDNPPSAEVAERAGFSAAGTLDDGTQVWVLDA